MAKKLLDIAVGIPLLIVTLPVLAIAAAGTAMSLRAWPFFTQTRIGINGRQFRLVKLRTLPLGAPRYAGKYELDHLHVPWFCQILRRTHLDELPQLLLVVAGSMSLVGPRPEMPFLHEAMPHATATKRTSVRPGCTGLWQLSEHCIKMIHEHPEFDAFYVANRSSRLDIWILLHTALRVVHPARPPLCLDDVPRRVLRAQTPRFDRALAHKRAVAERDPIHKLVVSPSLPNAESA